MSNKKFQYVGKEQKRNNEFFSNLAIEMDCVDIKTVKDFYYAVLRTIQRDLLGKNICYLPDFGRIFLHINKAKRIMDVNTREHIMTRDRKVVKFKPGNELKNYWKNK